MTNNYVYRLQINSLKCTFKMRNLKGKINSEKISQKKLI